jgi:hypothetical protein
LTKQDHELRDSLHSPKGIRDHGRLARAPVWGVMHAAVWGAERGAVWGGASRREDDQVAADAATPRQIDRQHDLTAFFTAWA